jgi:hypothetical protein
VPMYRPTMNQTLPTPMHHGRLIVYICDPVPISRGGHELMDLKSGRVITRRRVTEIPVTELVIQAVENMAHERGLATLKITGRHTSPISPADWIAGVDYDDHHSQHDEDYIEDEEAFIEEEIGNESLYDRIDPEELADITSTRDEVEEQEQGEEIQEIEEQEPDPVLQEENEVPEEPELQEENEVPEEPEVPEQEEVPQQEVYDEEPDEEAKEVKTTRSGRVVIKPTRFIEQEHVILHQKEQRKLH